MLIVSQCGTGIFDSKFFIGAWIKNCGNGLFMLKALFQNKEVILGTFSSEVDAHSAFNDLTKTLTAEQKCRIYQI